MITEDYCSFEVAKLLKEKGFNEQCRAAYTNYGKLFTTQIQQYVTNVLCSKGILWDCAAPTLQMAMKWLREVHNIHISVYVFNRELPITNVPIFYTCDITTEKLSSQQGHLRGAWKSYEETCEAAIKYCLENLI